MPHNIAKNASVLSPKVELSCGRFSTPLTILKLSSREKRKIPRTISAAPLLLLPRIFLAVDHAEGNFRYSRARMRMMTHRGIPRISV